MRRRKRKRIQPNVSLFPFLAVLICTLGVLIVMLVMAVKSAEVKAQTVQAEDDKSRQEEIDKLQFALDLRMAKIEGMQEMRPDAQKRVNDARTTRSHLEDSIRELKKEFEYVRNDLIELRNQELDVPEIAESFSKEDSENEIANLQQLIEEKQKSLEEKRALAKSTGPSTYKIVPYNGNRGTFRKPIFLECTKDAIVLQPSGIRLAKSEFEAPLAPGNSIDSALLATREYWQRYDIAGNEGSPYPLVVVRPEGAETFVLARHAMKSWDDEFGYELVESDQEIDFGPNDPQLEQEVQQAIEAARKRTTAIAFNQRQQRGMASGGGKPSFGVGPESRAARFERPDSRPGLTVSSSRGGFVSNQNESVESAVALQNNDSAGFDSKIAQVSNQFDSKASKQPSDNSNPAISKSQTGAAGELKTQNPYADLSVAKERGADWALPARTPGGTGYLRPIRIICSNEFMDVKTYSGSKRIPMRGATADSIDPLVSEIWKQIDSWGISSADGFWKPQLRFTVLDGAEQRFLELQGLLYKSGLAIEGGR